MFCFIGLIIFSILGIFSITHRKLAKEAFNCVFRRITFKPCDTGFDQKIKGRVIGKLLNFSPKLAKIVYRLWEPLSWGLVILFFVSLFFSIKSGYNLIKYKTCNPNNPNNCLLTSKEKCSSSDHCKPCDCGDQKTKCQPPDYLPCGGKEQYDCDINCKKQNNNMGL